jgi:hypothetical protein
MHILGAALLALSFVAFTLGSATAAPVPRRLPPAEDFHLTLQRMPQSNLPLGPSCGGEASLALLCQAFKVTLENASTSTVRISGMRCIEPNIDFWRLDPRSGSDWLLVSQPGQPTCRTLDWLNIRLKPGEKTEYATRLISPNREIQYLVQGSYSIRAQWTLFGCTEDPDGVDCLTPLQTIRPPSTLPPIRVQEPVTVISNVLQAESPPLPNLGDLKFGFEVAIENVNTTEPPAAPDNFCKPADKTADCVTFHYFIRNLGDHAVRNATSTCSDSGIAPEYRYESGDWQRVPQRSWLCSANRLIETVILPGGTIEGTFNLTTLRSPYDTKALKTPGLYGFRFTFKANACIASPDGSFCLQRPAEQPRVLSNTLQVQTPKP